MEFLAARALRFNKARITTYISDKDCDKKDQNTVDWVENTIVGLTNYYICFILLCTYVLTVNIMLINLLIAIFSNTYSDSKAKSGGYYVIIICSSIIDSCLISIIEHCTLAMVLSCYSNLTLF